MHGIFSRLTRLKLSAMLVGSLAVPTSSVLAAPGGVPADDPGAIELTAADIRITNEKAAAAYNALVAMWTHEFRELGYRFVAPRLMRYRSALRTSCGVMEASNASYCFSNNTIYFDDIFLAAQAKVVGQALATDGDMAAVGIIAHEMGHAVAMQLGYRSRVSYENESVADCLAGAFARQAQQDGSLEDGDIDEAFTAMAAAGDPEIRPTGDRRRDARLAARVSRRGHGTREQRMQNFREGLEGGGVACMDELRPQ
jgi:predicted metalloprotease